MNHLEKSKSIASSAPIFKKSLLAMCVIAATSQTHVYAAEPEAAAEPEEVVVTGIRGSLQSAQNIKKEAATVKDVITASDIGALPDKSVVEALQRVPGVAIERFEASSDPDHFSVEGGKVVVRGLNRVRSEFNGGDAFSARGDGGLGFSDIPPEMVGRVEVSKNQTSDLVEGGVAGTINLVTRKPFDEDGLVIAGTVKASYGDLIQEVKPSFSGILSNTWDTDAGKLGALISVATSEFSSRGDGVGIFNYYPEGTGGNAELAGKNIILPPAVSARQQFNSRDRLGIVGSLQWESPSEEFLATLDYIRSDSTVAWNERFIEYADQPFARGAKNRNPLNTAQPFTFDCPDGSSAANPCKFLAGTLKDDGYYVGGTRLRDDERVIDDFTFNLQYKPTDTFKVIGDVQYVKATNNISDFQSTGRFNAETRLDLRDSNEPSIELYSTAKPVDSVDSYFLRSAMDHVSDNDGDELAFKLDGQYDFEESSFFKSVKAGLRFSNKDVTIKESAYNWGSISESWMASVKDYKTLASKGFVEQHSFGSDFMNGHSLQQNNTFWFPTVSFISDTQAFYNNLNPILGDWRPLENRNVGSDGETPVDKYFLPSEIYNIKEDRSAVYARLDFGNDDAAFKYSGNVGLRYVNWQVESTGADKFSKAPADYDIFVLLSASNDQTTKNALAFSNKAAGPVTTVKGDEFSKVLPSLNLKVEVVEDLIARFAVSQSMYMPDLLSLRNKKTMQLEYSATPLVGSPTAATFETIQTTNAGNPYLQPELATNYDLALEWYFADVGSLTSTLFHKNIEDFIRSATSTVNITNPTNNITMPVAVMSPQNAGDAVVDGVELAFQSTFEYLGDAFANFGTQASYTYIDAEVKKEPPTVVVGDVASYGVFTGLPLEGLSKDNYNLALFYDNQTFQARFAYSWRSDYLLSSRDAIAFAPVYGEAGGQLDASFSYQLDDNYKIGFEANNLLDQVTKTSIQYNQEGVQTPRSYFVNDKRYAIYVQAKF